MKLIKPALTKSIFQHCGTSADQTNREMITLICFDCCYEAVGIIEGACSPTFTVQLARLTATVASDVANPKRIAIQRKALTASTY